MKARPVPAVVARSQTAAKLGVLLLTLGSNVSALAEGQQDLQMSASATLVRESNLFRLPAGVDAMALVGRPSPSATVGTGTLGLEFNRAFSMQRVEFEASLSAHRYQNFGYLDFMASNYRGLWRWAYTPLLTGNLSRSRTQQLNSFAEYQGFKQRNERIDTQTRLDLGYALDARWRLLSGLTRSTRGNMLPLAQEADYRLASFDAGARYLLASGSSATYSLKTTSGSYFNRPLSSSALYDDGFRQTDHAMQLDWAISRATTADFSAGYRQRSHPHYQQRDFGGTTAGAHLRWEASAKTLLTAGWTRELGTFETSTSNYVQSEQLSTAAAWQLSTNATLQVRLEKTRRDYLGLSGTPVSIRRKDHDREASVSLDWQPLKPMTMNAALRDIRRQSNAQSLGYTSSAISLQAQWGF